jgi:thiol-disulfide isomerase/thioredoxin
MRSRQFMTIVLVIMMMLSLAFASMYIDRSNGQGSKTLTDDIVHDASLGIADVASSVSNKVTVYFFYSSSCPHCIDTLPLIDDLIEKYPQVTIVKYQISGNTNNWDLYQEYNQKYHVSGQKVPSAFLGTTALIGEPAVRDSLESTIVSMLKAISPTVNVPGAPTKLAATVGNGLVNLSWMVPTVNGGGAIDYYVIYQNGTDRYHVKGTSATVNGLTNGVTYTFAVSAHNSAGIGPKSNAVNVSPSAPHENPDTAPSVIAGPPINVTTLAADGQVQISWNAPKDDGGADIKGYVLYWSLDPKGAFSSVDLDGTSYLQEGLENDQAVYYQVAAVNANGEGPRSATVSATPEGDSLIPSAPTNLTVSVVDDALSLTWTAASDEDTITGYNIYRGTNTSSMELLATASGTSFVDTNITDGQTYYYEVSAINATTEGLHSSEVRAIVAGNSGDASSNDSLLGALAIVGLIGVSGAGLLLLHRRGKK